MGSRRRAATLVIAMALVGAGCGGDDDAPAAADQSAPAEGEEADDDPGAATAGAGSSSVVIDGTRYDLVVSACSLTAAGFAVTAETPEGDRTLQAGGTAATATIGFGPTDGDVEWLVVAGAVTAEAESLVYDGPTVNAQGGGEATMQLVLNC